MAGRLVSVALIGFPNAGKTSLFNRLTGSTMRVVNYPGSTVETVIGLKKESQIVHVIDTPGISGSVPRSTDEAATLKVISEEDSRFPNITLTVLVLDALQLRRHLALVKQLRGGLGNYIVVVTMVDAARTAGVDVDFSILSSVIGVPVFGVDSRSGYGISELLTYLDVAIVLPTRRFVLPNCVTVEKLTGSFDWADQVVSRAVSKRIVRRWDIDQLFLHPVLGWVCLVSITMAFFWSVFALAAPLTDWVDGQSVWLLAQLGALLPDTVWAAFFRDGVVGSGLSVFLFVPQLIVLFIAIGLMESTGYLARGAALTDRPLSAVGLNGRSFVPLLTGYACAIPAMMAARTIPNRKERLITLFVIPLTSCSARLPVYGLLIAMLTRSAFKAGALMTGIYFLSFFVSLLVAAISSKAIQNDVRDHGFQIELPRWRLPDWGVLAKQVWVQTFSFVTKAGPIITGVGVLVWIVSNLPSVDHSIAVWLGKHLVPLLSPMGVDWRVGVALILSFAAREVFVTAVAGLFNATHAESTQSVLTVLRTATFDGTTTPIFSTPSIVGLLLFFMISMQCATTVAVAKREFGGWRVPVLMTVTYIVLGYAAAVLAVKVLSLI